MYYDKVREILQDRRNAAIARANMRNDLVREESEEIEKIDEELGKTGLAIFKAACSGGDVAELRRRNQELLKRRGEILVALGHPLDYTTPKFTCPDCSDTGFLNNGDQTCRCFREELMKLRISGSGIGELIEKQSFSNFDLEWYKYDEADYERMCANLKNVKKYVRDFPKKRGNLLIMGKTGTGKTHISTAVAKEIITLGYDVIYDSAQNIISDFEADKFKSGYGTYEPKGDKYTECDLLIIDDLGTEFVNQFTVSCLYNLLNTRQNKGLATIISTNLGYDELQQKYEDRIFSRIVGSGCRILVFVGRDHRIS